MNMTTKIRERLEIIAAILFRAGVIGTLMISGAAGAIWLAGDMIYTVHHELLDITKAQMHIVQYAGLFLFKLLIFTLFIIPWLAIRWTLRATPPPLHERDAGA